MKKKKFLKKHLKCSETRWITDDTYFFCWLGRIETRFFFSKKLHPRYILGQKRQEETEFFFPTLPFKTSF